MSNKVQLGAPSLNGKDANKLVAERFGECPFPLQITVTNLVAHALSFPEVSGLYMAACTDASKRSVTVEIHNMDAFQRLASSIEQIAELNHHETMLEIEVEDTGTFQEVEEAVVVDLAEEELVDTLPEIKTGAPTEPAALEKPSPGNNPRKKRGK